MSARCRQNYHPTSEAEVNKQINLELSASYVYMSMAYHFDRDDVALPGFHKYFKKASDGEREHAENHSLVACYLQSWTYPLRTIQPNLQRRVDAHSKNKLRHSSQSSAQIILVKRGEQVLLMKYQNQRGGRIILKDIKKPEKEEWVSGVDAMKAALALEKTMNEALFKLHEVAVTNKDDEMANFIESDFLHEEIEAIKEMSDYITNLERVGEGLGEYQFDKLTLDGE